MLLNGWFIVAELLSDGFPKIFLQKEIFLKKTRSALTTANPTRSGSGNSKARSILPVLTLLGAMVSLPVPRESRASTGSTFETIGVSTAVGTVLGASTLPFYGQPGKHLANLAYGASAGVLVGLGVALLGGVTEASSEDGMADSGQNPKSAWLVRGSSHQPLNRLEAATSERSHSQLLPNCSPAADLWMPLVSLTW